MRAIRLRMLFAELMFRGPVAGVLSSQPKTDVSDSRRILKRVYTAAEFVSNTSRLAQGLQKFKEALLYVYFPHLFTSFMQNSPFDNENQRPQSPQLAQKLREMFCHSDSEQKRHLDQQNSVGSGYNVAEAICTHNKSHLAGHDIRSDNNWHKEQQLWLSHEIRDNEGDTYLCDLRP